MGGYTPDFTAQAAQLQMQSDAGMRALESQQKLMKYGANQPLETWTPDIWGDQGMQTQTAQIAAINAFKNKELEQQINPEVAKVREQLPKMIAEDLKPGVWQKQMDDWAKHAGLVQMMGSGTQDSTVGRSALFDASTMQGMALKRAQEQLAGQLLAANQQPIAGIDPQSVLNMQNTAAAKAMEQRAGFRNAMLNAAGGAQQSVQDWVNQMAANTNSAAGAFRQEWQNKENNRNALIGAGIGALGSIGGAAIGGPMGAAAGGSLGKMAGSAAAPMNTMSDAPSYNGAPGDYSPIYFGRPVPG